MSIIEDSSNGLNLSFAQLVSAPVGAFLLAWLLIYITGVPIYLGLGHLLRSFLWGCMLAFATFGMVVLLTRMSFARSLREICKQLLPIFDDLPIWKIIAISLAAGIGEELLFRGFLQQWLAGFLSIEMAIGIAALIFGVLHFASFSYFVLTTFLGMLFGFTYLETSSLLMVMTWHAAYNLMVIWVFSRKPELLLLR